MKYQYEGILDTDAEDTKKVEEMIDRIEAVRDASELKTMWRDLRLEYGVDVFADIRFDMSLIDTYKKIFSFEFYCNQSLEDIIDSDSGAVAARDELADSLKTIGISPEEATARAIDIVYVLHEIAGHSDMELINQSKRKQRYSPMFLSKYRKANSPRSWANREAENPRFCTLWADWIRSMREISISPDRK